MYPNAQMNATYEIPAKIAPVYPAAAFGVKKLENVSNFPLTLRNICMVSANPGSTKISNTRAKLLRNVSLVR